MSEQQWQERYLERYYSKSAGFVDGTTDCHELCRTHIAPGSKILEIGAGPQNPTTDYISKLGNLQGVDIDPAVLLNSALRQARVVIDDHYPYGDNSFDACVSNYVVEHVENPSAHLKTIHRVLRRNGVYVFRTPNLFHYVSLVSKYSPHWFHRLVANRLRNLPEDSHAPYPTVYRMSTVRKLKRLCRDANLECEVVQMVEKEPRYGLRTRLLFIAFMFYERLVNCSPVFSAFRVNIFCVIRKRSL